VEQAELDRREGLSIGESGERNLASRKVEAMFDALGLIVGRGSALPTDERFLPQALKEAGYSTAIIGKWHLGHADQKYWPRQRGFDYQYGPLIGEIDYFRHEAEGVVDWYRDNKPVREDGYSTSCWGTTP
jgi:arylsulfatase A-like enzyme